MKVYEPSKMKWFLLWLVLIESAVVFVLWTIKSQQEGLISYLQDSQRLMIWKMDDSCFNQIQNNSDGVIRLKIGDKEVNNK